VRAPSLLASPWFVAPVAFALIHDVRPERFRLDTATLPAAGADDLDLAVDDVPVALPATLDLRPGARLDAHSRLPRAEVFLLVPVEHAVYFEVPFPHTTLEPMRLL
jgi:hypothetical protein